MTTLTLQARWRALTRREKTLVMVAAGVMVVALGYALLWLPMRNATLRMNSELPHLRRQLVQMRAYVDALAVPAPSAPASAPKLAELRALAARASMPVAAVQGEPGDGDTLRVRVDTVTGDALMALLDLAQHEQHWWPSELHMARLAEPSRMRAEFTLTSNRP